MLKYRKDIDGMRALAVLLVIFYHLDFPLITGGFIGVDVFFVLSGFLITGIIKQRIEDNSFTYSDFYLKRLRRIYPVLLVVMLVTILAGYFILLPSDFYKLSKSTGLTLISVSNFYFNNISSGYFGANTALIPLLHTWSLAVEEQFYLLWPITLVLLYKFISKEKIPLVIIASTILLLFLSQYLAINYKSSSYFLLPSRAFELLSGAALSLYLPKIPKTRKFVLDALSLASIGVIIFISLSISKLSTFPGFNAAIVCLASCIYLYTGQFNAVGNKLFSGKIIVYIGLISYSLYLWHWPLISYVNYLSIDKTSSVKLIILLSTIILSLLSYHLIENKLRFKYKYSFKKTAALYFGVPFVLLAAFITVTKKTDGMEFRFTSQEESMIAAVRSGYDACKFDKCSDDYKNALTNTVDKSQFLLIGDSHASAVKGFVNVIANDAKKSGSFYSEASTPFITQGIAFNANTNNVDREITAGIENLSKKIEQFEGDTIVIANRFPLYLYGKNEPNNDHRITVSKDLTPPTNSQEELKNYWILFNSSIERLADNGKKIVIIYGIPELAKDLSKCEILNSFTGINGTCYIDKDKHLERIKAVDLELTKLKSRMSNVVLINISDYTCNDRVCNTIIESTPLYRDDDHLNYFGSKLLGQKYLESNDNPLN
ncbi:acyltransferase family protein [Vibrio splendidus]|uniref:acyltransferase family protein n=1 Tax=Vibrio splendidus TaxID=29497 RepID=UPI00352CC358